MIEIQQTLVLSTGHVSYATSQWLDEALTRETSPIAGGVYDGIGWFLSTNKVEAPADLQAVLKFAADRGCRYVLMDRDACYVDDLEAFDW